ncbi:MAG: WecB/TagA/CpsF family glycosyltransferase [Dictyoglomaceae bacterium]
MKALKILNIPFTFFSNEKEFEEKVLSFLREDRVHTIFTPNAEIIALAERNNFLKKILMDSDLNLPDGIGVLLLAKKMGYRNLRKFAGIDAMINLISVSQREKKFIYFLGAKQEVLNNMILKLKEKYKEILISGYHHGYFSIEEEEKIINDINTSNTDILFVALGAPKQEAWIYKNKDKLKVKIAMGVGGSFDVLSQRKKRAPKIFINLGLEWLYRILQEPKRLVKRFPNLLYFLYIYIRA